jgi:acetyltransferase-like isoleucine patch superfamily enzyme
MKRMRSFQGIFILPFSFLYSFIVHQFPRVTTKLLYPLALISRLLLHVLKVTQYLLKLFRPCPVLIRFALYKCGGSFRPGLWFSVLSPQNICIGDNFSSGEFVRLQAWPSYKGKIHSTSNDVLISIGDNVYMNNSSFISACLGVEIGNYCLIGSNVFITDNSHGSTSLVTSPRIDQPLSSKGKVVIGQNVWICSNVIITSGCAIGSNSIIAANSVVTGRVEAGSLYGGVPARLIRRLDLV